MRAHDGRRQTAAFDDRQRFEAQKLEGGIHRVNGAVDVNRVLRLPESQLIVDGQLPAQLPEVIIARENRVIETIDLRAVREHERTRKPAEDGRGLEDVNRHALP